MKIKTFLICWLPTFIVVFALNGVFHGILAANFFNSHFYGLAPVVRRMQEIHPGWVALLDLILTFGMVYFITVNRADKIALSKAAFAGGLLNLISAGAWNFANAAMFPWSIAVIFGDVSWHIVLGMAGGIMIAGLYNKSTQKARFLANAREGIKSLPIKQSAKVAP